MVRRNSPFDLIQTSYDIAESNSFVLQERISRKRVNYHWIKCSAVRDISATALSTLLIENASLPAIDIAILEERIRKADEQSRSYKASIGVAVTQEAQEIFDSLSKTMPCSWSANQIVCYRVRISPPYTTKDCDGPEPGELERVRKVLEGERSKLEKKRKAT